MQSLAAKQFWHDRQYNILSSFSTLGLPLMQHIYIKTTGMKSAKPKLYMIDC